MMQDRNAPPLNPLPMVVWVLALPMIAMEVVLSAGASGFVGGMEGMGWRLQALERFVFSPQLMQAMMERGEYPPQHVMRLVTYPFVHGGVTHALFVVVILLALGKMVGEVFRWWAVLVIFFAAAVAGAFAFMAVLRGGSGGLWADRGVHLPALGQSGGGGVQQVPGVHADRDASGVPASVRVAVRGWV
jgi:membrane associated rhomboid family serine protease